MTRLAVEAGAGLVTAVVLGLIRWRFRSRRASVASVALTMAMLFTGSVVAAPAAFAGGQGGNDHSGYVFTNPPSDCEFIHQYIQQGNPFQPGNPRIDTYASVDQGFNCSNKGFVVRPSSLSMAQDLKVWTGVGDNSVLCNTPGAQGPRIANDGFWTHSMSTGFGWKIGGAPPCGNTWYIPKSYNYYNVWNGGPWDGNTMTVAWLFVWGP
jgi:hypothetical protein